VRTEVLQGIADRPPAAERAPAPPPPPARAVERPAPPPGEAQGEPRAPGDRRGTAIAQIARGIVRRAQG